MNDIINNPGNRTPSKGLRLAARIIGTLWVLICIFLFVGYYLEGIQRNAGAPSKPPDVFGIVIVISLSIALCGLIIAWWREGIGGFISLFGIIIAGALLIIDPKLDFSLPVFSILSVPSILYLSYWWLAEKSNHRHQTL